MVRSVPSPPDRAGGAGSGTSRPVRPRRPAAPGSPAASLGGQQPAWAPWLVIGCYLLGACALTSRLWADPAGRMVPGDPGDVNLFAWFMRYSAAAVTHGRLPALVTTGLNAPQGISMMWNTSMLLPGVVLAPVTLLAGPQTSLTVLLTAGFAGSAASMFCVLRRWDASVSAAALGGAVYGFSPAMLAAGIGHFHLQFAVLPPLIIDALLRIVTGRGSVVRAGLWLGLATAAQLFTGEELLTDTAVAALVMLAVLALCQPRAAVALVRKRARVIAGGLGTAAAVTAAACGYALWVQFRGPLASHGSPWQVGQFRNQLYAFVTPSASMLFHTGASAAAAARYPEPLPEYLAYLGWPLLIVLLAAAVLFWADPKVRLMAATFAALELFSLGAAGVAFVAVRTPAWLLPWHWLQGIPVLADVLPDRFSILADAAAAAVLSFALDRARATARRGRGGQLTSALAASVAVLAVMPLIPRPVPATGVTPVPVGWQAAFARLRLAPGAPVLVIPDIRLGLRWQAETGVPGSMVGGGATTEPGPGGQATSYSSSRLATARYLAGLWFGSPSGPAPSNAQIGSDLSYWRLGAIVTIATSASPLARFLAREFGPPTVQLDGVLAWWQPHLRSVAAADHPKTATKGP